MKPTKLKNRKLYAVRWFPASTSFSTTVGFKGRLLPRTAANRIAKRLCAAGIDAIAVPLQVILTPQQSVLLDSRYA